MNDTDHISEKECIQTRTGIDYLGHQNESADGRQCILWNGHHECRFLSHLDTDVPICLVQSSIYGFEVAECKPVPYCGKKMSFGHNKTCTFFNTVYGALNIRKQLSSITA